MKNNQTPIIIVIIAILVVGGLLYYDAKNTHYFINSNDKTPLAPADETPTSTEVRDIDAPVVTTISNANTKDTTAFLIGTVMPNGAVTNYWYEYGRTSALGSKTTSQRIGSGYVILPASGYLTQLTKNTKYHFRLVAENAYGKSLGSTYIFETTNDGTPIVGGVPTTQTLSASNVERTTAQFNGSVTPNKNATQYWFEYGRSRDLGNAGTLSSAGDGTEKIATSMLLTNLDPMTTYYFRMNAQNQFGTVLGEILSMTTRGPVVAATIPVAITRNAQGITETRANLRGAVDPNGGETTYWFEYGTTPTFLEQSTHTTAKMNGGNSLSADLRSVTVQDLTTNTTYYFRVIAQSSLGIVRGDTASFKTK